MNPNSSDNLIPMKSRTPEERRRLASMGGKAKNTEKQALSLRIAWMKKKGMAGNLDAEYTHAILTEPNINAIQMQDVIQSYAKFASGKPELAKDVVSMQNTWHKMHFGDKKTVDIRAVNIHLSGDDVMSDDQISDIMGDLE